MFAISIAVGSMSAFAFDTPIEKEFIVVQDLTAVGPDGSCDLSEGSIVEYLQRPV